MAIKDLTRVDRHGFLCNGSSCSDRGAADSTVALRDEIRACGLDDRAHTTKTLCNGRCDDGPIMIVQPDGIWYKRVDPVTARQIVRTHVRAGVPVESHVLYRWGHATIATADPDTRQA
jgi:(2Fe-2S) ferredoxin